MRDTIVEAAAGRVKSRPNRRPKTPGLVFLPMAGDHGDLENRLRRPRRAAIVPFTTFSPRSERPRLNWPTLLGIALGLAMDAFAVSIVAGLSVRRVTPRHTFRIGFHFGLFQAIMPILGWLAGSRLVDRIGDYDHWVAFGLLGYVGGKMLWDSRGKSVEKHDKDPTRGISLIVLSVATSIDALAVGLTMGVLGVSIWIPALVIGLVACAMSTIGITFGSRFGARLGHGAEAVGGSVLLLIGGRILLTHLFG